MSSNLTEGSICPIDKVILGLILNLALGLNLGTFKRLREGEHKMFRVLIGLSALCLLVACDHGSNIPIDGTGGAGGDGGGQCGLICDGFTPEEVVNHCDTFCGGVVCSIEGVEECSADCPREEIYNEGYGDGFRACSELCDLDARYDEGYEAGYEAGYAEGFADGVDSVTCECPNWPPEDGCSYPDDAPPGHLIKECRGRPDKN